MDSESITKIAREAYGKSAKQSSGCGCGCSCGGDAGEYAKSLGYSDEELNLMVDPAN